MEQRRVSIRDDQSEWIDREGIDLSRLVREAIDEKMRPSASELSRAYRENASDASETNAEWSRASMEANAYLGENPNSE